MTEIEFAAYRTGRERRRRAQDELQAKLMRVLHARARAMVEVGARAMRADVEADV
jgi:hypothetical protein